MRRGAQPKENPPSSWACGVRWSVCWQRGRGGGCLWQMVWVSAAHPPPPLPTQPQHRDRTLTVRFIRRKTTQLHSVHHLTFLSPAGTSPLLLRLARIGKRLEPCKYTGHLTFSSSSAAATPSPFTTAVGGTASSGGRHAPLRQTPCAPPCCRPSTGVETSSPFVWSATTCSSPNSAPGSEPMPAQSEGCKRVCVRVCARTRVCWGGDALGLCGDVLLLLWCARRGCALSA